MTPSIRPFSRSTLSALFALALTGGTATVHAETDTQIDTALAFSGGGYHALSGGAAWLMGMMERRGEYDLGKITANAGVIGANSGGSWLTVLNGYSPTFVEELQQPGAYRRFAVENEGYMGKVWSYIKHPTGGCLLMPNNVEKLLCAAFYQKLMSSPKAQGQKGFINFLLSGGGQWQTVIEKSVFGKDRKWGYYPEVEALTLASPRNPWAQEKDLVLAGTILTQAPSLTFTDKGKLGFKNVQAVEGTQAFSDKHPLAGGVPVMLASKGGTAVDLLPGGTLDLAYGTWIKGDRGWGFYPTDNTALENEAANPAAGSLPVIHAAAISSAAGGGFVDIPIMKKNLLDGKDIATVLNGFAPAYQMRDADTGRAVMDFHANVHKEFVTDPNDPLGTTQTLTNNQVVRYADGGFVDNTAVAQLLRYLQDANDGTIPKGFNVVVFDDFPLPRPYWDPKTKQGAFPTGSDVAGLFGFDGCDKDSCSMQHDGIHQSKLIVFSYAGMSAQVFPSDQYFQPADQGGAPLEDRLFWSPGEGEKILCDIGGEKQEQPLLYSRYEVTVDADAPGSKMFGISEANDKVPGTLHVFAILGDGAAVVPGNDDQFACFNTMVTGMVDQITRKGTQCDPTQPRKTGNDCSIGDYLEHALKL